MLTKIKRFNNNEHTICNVVHRPWGKYTILEEGEGYKVKRIEVNPHSRISLQFHLYRSEYWVVVSGIAQITSGNLFFNLRPNESTRIPAKTVHRLENPGIIPLQIIEIQYGEYLAEDDIVRLEDDYQRHNSDIE